MFAIFINKYAENKQIAFSRGRQKLYLLAVYPLHTSKSSESYYFPNKLCICVVCILPWKFQCHIFVYKICLVPYYNACTKRTQLLVFLFIFYRIVVEFINVFHPQQQAKTFDIKMLFQALYVLTCVSSFVYICLCYSSFTLAK